MLAGGHAAFNPEPIADFIDAAVLGDGEEAVGEITAIVRAWKHEGGPGGRDELLLRLARTEAVYVPRFYDVDYLPDGRIQRVVPNRADVPFRVHKRTTMDLDAWPYPTQAAGAAGRDGARAVRGGDLPRLYPGLPVLPGRHDHPSGPGAVDHHGRPDGAGRAGVLRLLRGRPALALQRGSLRDRRHLLRAWRPQYEGTNVSLSLPSTRVDAFNVDAGRGAVPQRAPHRADLRPRGRFGADPSGDQQDGHRRRT